MYTLYARLMPMSTALKRQTEFLPLDSQAEYNFGTVFALERNITSFLV